MRIIQAFTKEEDEHRKFMKASVGSLDASLRLYTLQNFYSGAITVMMSLGTAFVVWIGARHVLAGALSIGDIVIFTTYLASLYGPIYTISQTWGVIQGAKVGFQRVSEILDIERDMQDGNRVFPETGARGEIVLEEVSFQYTPDQPVLKDICVEVRPGHRFVEAIEEMGPIGQAGEGVVQGLLGERLVFADQLGVIGVDLVEQGVEVLADAVQLGQLCGRYALALAVAAHRVGDLGQGGQRLQDVAAHAPAQPGQGEGDHQGAGQ